MMWGRKMTQADREFELNLEEIRMLSEFLEAEAAGQSFDRQAAVDLADHLRKKYGCISQTMTLMIDRLVSHA